MNRVAMMMLGMTCVAALGTPAQAAAAEAAPTKVIRAGIIGLDTSHAPAFTDLFNDPKAGPEIAGIKVVAAFPAGSPDLAASRDRVADYTKQLKDKGVEIVDSIPALLA